MRADSILDLIGRTPHVRLSKLFPDREVWMKLERANPGGSIKDRIALSMVEAAEQDGRLKPGGTIIEPTSGNTGIGLALVAAVRGYRLLLVMPESMSVERRRIMAAYGAELELTPREKGMKGAIERAREILAERPDAWMPMQFENHANVRVHERTTAVEIISDFPEGIDAIITGVGTGGHITGAARVLKSRWPRMQAWAVEPMASPVLSGGEPGPHRLQGIGAGFVPAIYDPAVVDGVIQISEEDAFAWARRAAREEGILLGASSGASLAAVAARLPSLPESARALTWCYDTGERYLSVEGLF
jgi:cysteine synthase A